MQKLGFSWNYILRNVCYRMIHGFRCEECTWDEYVTGADGLSIDKASDEGVRDIKGRQCLSVSVGTICP